MSWTCSECGRRIGDHEYTSKGRTEDEHICTECFWKLMDRPERVSKEVARMATRQEQVLMHLYELYGVGDDYEMPYGTTQDGIAEAVGIRRSQVSLELKRLEAKGLVYHLRRHAYREGCLNRQHRKCYKLNVYGRAIARCILESSEGVM